MNIQTVIANLLKTIDGKERCLAELKDLSDTSSRTSRIALESTRAFLEVNLKELNAILSDCMKVREADSALREALAQPQGEPHKDAFDKLVEAAYRRGRREERLEALTQKQEPVAWVDTLREAFFDGFRSVATYNDTLLNSADEEWENHKQYYTAPPSVEAAVLAERQAIKTIVEAELSNTSTLTSLPRKSGAAWNILQKIKARGIT